LDSGAPHRTWRPTIAAGVWLLCTSWAAAARAAPFELTWSAPAGCPSREQMIEATRARLGESETTAPPELFVRGTVTPEREAFVVSFLVKDTSGADVGERKVRVQGRACKAIEEPAALVLATMISVVRPHTESSIGQPTPSAPPDGPEVRALDVQGAPPPTSAVPAGGARAPAAASSSSVASSSRSRANPSLPPHITLGAAGVGSIGIVPKAGFGLALRTTYAPTARLLFGLETTFEAGASVRTGRGEVGFEVLTASISAGIQLLRWGTAEPGTQTGAQTATQPGWTAVQTRPALELVPQLAFRGGVLRTVPSGFQLVKRQAHPLALAGIGALLRAWVAPHFYAEALPQAEIVLVRDVFEATEGRTTYFLHQPSAVGGRLELGLGYEFP
jgi:hypothetical protein